MGNRQHHDLRSDELGFTYYERVPYAGGWPHCCGTPPNLGVIAKLGPNATLEEKEAFSQDIARRKIYAAQILQHSTGKLPMRARCCARGGTMGCPLVPVSMVTAQLKGLPIVENPPNPDVDGEPLPKVCVQDSLVLHPPDEIRKLHQVKYWGSKQWATIFGRRTSVEGSYGDRKNVSTENLRRGLFQSTGIAWTNLVGSLVAASYNLRMLENWHERSGDGDPTHPLLAPRSEPAPWMYLSPAQSQSVIDLYEATLGALAVEQLLSA